jgi:general secretion pathway protein J
MARAPGFTLVELLVAIGILAMVAVLGWRGLDGIVRARVALTAQLEQTRGMQLAFAQMQSDCEHLADGALLNRRQNLTADSARLTLVRTVFAENEPSRLQVVAYRIVDGVLTRSESRATRDLAVLDTLWQAALGQAGASAGDGGASVALQAGVDALAVRLWSNSAWRAPSTSDKNGVPAGLEVTLRLREQQAPLVKVFLLGAL